MRLFCGIVAEGLRVARASWVTSVVTAVMAGAVAVAVLGTTGQSATTEQAVLAGLDSPQARVLVVTDDRGEAHIDPASVAMLQRQPTVEAVVGVGTARDYKMYDARIGRFGPAVPVSTFYGSAPQLTVTRGAARPGTVLVPVSLQKRLALAQPVGALGNVDGQLWPVVGEFAVSEPFGFLGERGLLTPAEARDAVGAPGPDQLTRIFVLARSLEDISTIRQALPGLVIAEKRTYSVADSQQLLAAKEQISSELGAGRRQLMIYVLAGALMLEAVTMLAAVSARRRDFGRRRALGASRSSIVTLVLVQTLAPALAGVALGAGAGAWLVHRWTTHWPPLSFLAGMSVLTLLATAAAAVAPALLAATRDPVRILRVP